MELVAYFFTNRTHLMLCIPLCNCGQNIGCKPDILTAYRPLTVTFFRPALEPGVERHIKYTKKIKLNARRHNVKFRSIQII